MAKTRYNKLSMPLKDVKDKEFLARRLNCEGVGFGLIRIKPGRGAGCHRRKVSDHPRGTSWVGFLP